MIEGAILLVHHGIENLAGVLRLKAVIGKLSQQHKALDGAFGGEVVAEHPSLSCLLAPTGRIEVGKVEWLIPHILQGAIATMQ